MATTRGTTLAVRYRPGDTATREAALSKLSQVSMAILIRFTGHTDPDIALAASEEVERRRTAERLRLLIHEQRISLPPTQQSVHRGAMGGTPRQSGAARFRHRGGSMRHTRR